MADDYESQQDDTPEAGSLSSRIDRDSIKESAERDHTASVNENYLKGGIRCPCCGKSAIVTVQIQHT